MIFNPRDLSPDQKVAIESLLGRSISDEEEISVRALQASKASLHNAAQRFSTR